MTWLGLFVLLAVVIPLQIAVLGGMMPRRIVARAQVRMPGRATDIVPDAERAAAETIASELEGAATPEITCEVVDVEGGARVVFTVAGEVPGRLARMTAHFLRFPRLANRCVSRLRGGAAR